MKRNAPTTIQTREVRALLARYDLVLDVLTDAVSRENPQPRGHILLEAHVEHEGTCSQRKHPIIYEVPLDDAPELPAGGAFWEATSTDSRRFQARRLVFETSSNNGPLAFFFMLFDQITGPPKRIEVTAKACGATYLLGLARGEDVYLNGLVRIHRKDSYALAVTMQPYRSEKYERRGTQLGWTAENAPANAPGRSAGREDVTTRTSVTGGTTRTSATSVASGVRESTAADVAAARAGTLLAPTTTTSETVAGQRLLGVAAPSRTVSTGPTGTGIAGREGNQEFRLTPNGAAPTPDGGQPWERLGDGWARRTPTAVTAPPRIDLVFTRNGQPLPLVDECRKFLEGLQKIQDTIKRFGDLIKKAPQVGWSFGWTAAFMSGSLEVSYEPAHVAQKREDERWYPLGFKAKVKAEIVFLTASISASFGVKFDMGWLASAEATLTGTFKTEIKLVGEMTVEPSTSRDESTVAGSVLFQPKVEAEVSGVLRASAVGVTLLDVRVTLTGGITVYDQANARNGGIGWQSGKGFTITGDLCTTPVVLKVTATSVGGGMEPSEYKLLDSQLLWKLTSP